LLLPEGLAGLRRKTHLFFLNFRSVCPERLGKLIVLSKQIGAKEAFLAPICAVGLCVCHDRDCVQRVTPCEKRHSFLSFPYVSLEPVLVKRCILYINGAKSGVFLTLPAPHHLVCVCVCKNRRFFFVEFPLCLSRACLGKIIIFVYKRLKKTVFGLSFQT